MENKIDINKIVMLEGSKILKTSNAKINGIKGFEVTSKSITHQKENEIKEGISR